MANPGAEKVQHCGPCDAGQYCHTPGLSGPEGPCEPGFYCSGGANTATPVTKAYITQYNHTSIFAHICLGFCSDLFY